MLILERFFKSIIAKTVAIIGALFLTFFGFGGYNIFFSNTAAEFGGTKVTLEEFQRSYSNIVNNLNQQGLSEFNEEELKNIRRRAALRAISQKLAYEIATEYGVSATEQEIAQIIITQPNFQTDGRFDRQKYDDFLRGQNNSANDYEQRFQHAHSIQKLLLLFRNSAFISKKTAEFFYNVFNNNIAVKVLEIPFEYFADKARVSDEAISSYYDDNKATFLSNTYYDLKLLLFDDSSFLELTEEVVTSDIERYYQQNSQEFLLPAQYHSSHILFLIEGKDFFEVEQQAQQIQTELAQSPEKFAEYAEKYSDDPISKSNGGVLGWVHYGSFVEPYENKVREMTVNTVSELVLSDFGFHIILLHDKKEEEIAPFNAVVDNIRTTLQERLLVFKLQQIANQFDGQDDISKNEDYQTLAEQYPQSIREVERFPLNNNYPDFLTENFEQELSKNNSVGMYKNNDKRLMFYQIEEVYQPRSLTLEETSSDIKIILTQQEITKIIQNEINTRYKKEIIDSITLEKIAQEFSTEIIETELRFDSNTLPLLEEYRTLYEKLLPVFNSSRNENIVFINSNNKSFIVHTLRERNLFSKDDISTDAFSSFYTRINNERANFLLNKILNDILNKKGYDINESLLQL